MFGIQFHKMLWLLLVVVLILLILIPVLDPASKSKKDTPGTAAKALEKELAFQARAALLQKLYAPVEELRARGDVQSAFFKLDELNRTYPGEPHGYILKAEIQQQSGAIEEAAASYVEGVKRGGEYLDKQGPLSRRAGIERLVEEGEKFLAPRLKANPDNSSLLTAMRNINYLKSRLAGGCE